MGLDDLSVNFIQILNFKTITISKLRCYAPEKNPKACIQSEVEDSDVLSVDVYIQLQELLY